MKLDIGVCHLWLVIWANNGSIVSVHWLRGEK